MGVRMPADAFVGFIDRKRVPCLVEMPRSREARNAGADNSDFHEDFPPPHDTGLTAKSLQAIFLNDPTAGPPTTAAARSLAMRLQECMPAGQIDFMAGWLSSCAGLCEWR
jgi:hypothetical protein